jgi:hypothetical protein
MSVKSFVAFLKDHLQEDPASISPIKADPQETLALLRPLLKPYQGKKGERVRALRYEPAEGKTVDAALEKWAQSLAKAPPAMPPLAQRVLVERLRQVLMLAKAGSQAGQTMLVPPRSLSDRQREVAAALLWLHDMELPYPVEATTVH